MSAKDKQVGGDHYKALGPYQPWEVNRHWLTREQYVGFLLGTVNAYLGRYNAEGDGKGGLLDLKKAAHTLQALIEFLEEAEHA